QQKKTVTGCGCGILNSNSRIELELKSNSQPMMYTTVENAQDLTNAGITYILTVDSEQPTSPDGSFRMKRFHSLDESSTDLLSHLDDCILFICDACKASKAVLVHWCASPIKSGVA
uniref:Uncharacterized protein n=1 Tax=Oncorhynchus tshawytscha TaxID=74940 RepID=A0A8C8I909_ONCTS